MLTLQIVPGEIVRVETFSCKPGMKSVLSRQTSRAASHINSRLIAYKVVFLKLIPIPDLETFMS